MGVFPSTGSTTGTCEPPSQDEELPKIEKLLQIVLEKPIYTTGPREQGRRRYQRGRQRDRRDRLSLSDEADHSYHFLSGFTVGAGDSLTVNTGSGNDTEGEFNRGES